MVVGGMLICDYILKIKGSGCIIVKPVWGSKTISMRLLLLLPSSSSWS